MRQPCAGKNQATPALELEKVLALIAVPPLFILAQLLLLFVPSIGSISDYNLAGSSSGRKPHGAYLRSFSIKST